MKTDAKPIRERKQKQEEANVPVKTRIKREIVAWFWVAFVFLLINVTAGQARNQPVPRQPRDADDEA